MGSPTYLFAYGTLLKGHAAPEIAHVVKRLKKVGTGSIRGSLFDFGEYPGVVGRNGSQVRGTLYEVPDRTLLRELDDYEGYRPSSASRSLFVRRKRIVRLASGDKRVSWVYLFNRSARKGRAVPSGDYSKTRRGARSAAR